MNETYNKETIDAKLESIHESIKAVGNKVDAVDGKVSYTNGKVKRQEKVLLVVGTAVIVILVMSGSRFVDLIRQLFL